MIPLRRRRIQLPLNLLDLANGATRDALRDAANRKRQSRTEFKPDVWQEFGPHLRRLSHGKCAYCESPVEQDSWVGVDHFRPIRSVAEVPDHRGYYWLAYDWDNLLPACAACSHNKGDKFPLEREDHRATSPGSRLNDEAPLLLDPCAGHFNPRHHFATHEVDRGVILPRTDRARATIDILGLNRSPLIGARQRLFHEIAGEFKRLFRRKNRSFISLLSIRRAMIPQTRAINPYAGFARLAVARLADDFMNRRTQTKLSVARVRVPRVHVEVATERPAFLRESRPPSGYIQKIDIRHFKCIPKLTLEFDYAREQNVGWQVFLGENGAGKSSVLQALALALGGRANLRSVDAHAADFLRKGSARGSVRLWMSTLPEPIRLGFSRSGFRYSPGQDGANFFVRAYGATRLLPRKDQPKPEALPGERRVIQNLFNPHFPLCDVPAWLGALPPDDFDKVATTLKDLLKLGETDNLILERKDKEVIARMPGRASVPLHYLSQGQQAALVLAVDIMAGIMKDREETGIPGAPGDFREAAGIVLLDEIDAHLHPRWKMEIVRSLRAAFRQIQFIVTTHEPLCLRGLGRREIVLMRHEEGEFDAAVTDISPEGWRVDQLLTSPLFGLNSTIDPGVEAEFREYYALLAKPEAKYTALDRERRAALAAKVQARNRLGYTRRDQLLYEVIDKCLAEEDQASLAQQPRVHERTKQRVTDLWRRLTSFA